MATREKNFWILLIFILSGIVIGGLLASFANDISWLKWLAYGQEFGLKTPIELDFSVFSLTFGLWIKINVANIIGMAIAIFIYRKI